MADGPLIVQSDKTLLLEVDNPRAQECRAAIAPFAELEKSPEHVHTYRLSNLALWNAKAAGHDAEQVVDALITYSKFPVPNGVLIDVAESMARYGQLVLEDDGKGALILRATDPSALPVLEEAVRSKKVAPFIGERVDPLSVAIEKANRGHLKQALVGIGWPADDRAGYIEGESLTIAVDYSSNGGWNLRDYQDDAVTSFVAGGSGVVVLPCGAGKTIVGAAAMGKLSTKTLILVTNTVSARQWKRELLARTTLKDEDIGEYSGEKKEIRPVTIATYQIMIARKNKQFTHLGVFGAEDWGLIIYDEVHLLPAPVFRMTADIQSRRRLGLTATLVREDGREQDVFSLIGPKRYDAPWRDIEAQGWIAPARCTEVRVTLTDEERLSYALAEPEEAYRVAATAVSKHAVIDGLLERHKGEQTLVIGQYVEQLQTIAQRFELPIITGKTPNKEREKLFDQFRKGEIKALVVSKVANFSIDLPDATVAIQVSGTFGSRQEEAQRLGRLLRPKSDRRQAEFYTVISRDTNDQLFAANRQRFLAEQGYAYEIVDAQEITGRRPSRDS